MVLQLKNRGMGYTERFHHTGFHPGLDKTGSMTARKLTVAPGQYEVASGCACLFKKTIESMWTRQMRTAEFSANLGFRCADLLAYREFMSKQLGPGAHEISESLFKKEPSSRCKNQMFGSQKRFFMYPNKDPPPGIYKTDKIVHQFGKACSTFGNEGRFKEKKLSWALAPNRYEIKDPGSMQALFEKVVSKRGPYDSFTGPRDPTNVFNKFSPGKRCSPDKIYLIPTEIDYLIHHHNKRRTGVFLKAKRFPPKPTVRMMLADVSLCFRDPLEPSAATYTIPSESEFFQVEHLLPASYAFGQTNKDKRYADNWKIAPGPGRYNTPKVKKCGVVHGGTSSFKSKTQRTEYKAPVYNAY